MQSSNSLANSILRRINKVKDMSISTSEKIVRIIALRKSLKEAVYDKKEQ